MARLRLTGAFVAAAVFGFLASPAAAKIVHVDIRKLVFEPANIAVEVGDTVEWTNHDVFAHTATADDKSWEVVLAPQTTGSYVIANAGVIGYFCRFHPNMRGKITVTAPQREVQSLQRRALTW